MSKWKNVVVHEKTHHGEFRHERTIEVHALTANAMRGILLSCPYVYEPEHATVRNLAQELREQGLAQHGWTDWRIDL